VSGESASLRKPSSPQPGSSARGKLAQLVPAIAALASLAIYLLTLVPEVNWGDSAELSLQAYQLGVTHPPGYPVHTFLGKLFTLFFQEPALATNVLSAVCTSVAVGLLGWIALRTTGNPFAALAAALTFALSPFIWEKAVVTEIYNVNICFVALAIALTLAWFRKPSRGLLCATAAVFGLSLGTYLANLLFLPAFLFLVLYRNQRRRWTAATAFLLITAIAGIIVLSWSHFRSRVIVPVGTLHVPDTPAGFIQYLTGAQYQTTTIHTPAFYLKRLVEHGQLFAKNFLGVGVILGLVGLWQQWTKHRAICICLLIIFAINFGYFTGYAAPDYFYMVTPSYFVFALWIAYGLAFFFDQRSRLALKIIGVIISMALVAGLFAWKLPVRLIRSRSTQVTDFALSSFENLPEDAVVVSAWRRFVPLLYFQETRTLRQDLILIERKKDEMRHYTHGTATGWQAYVESLSDSAPVFIDRIEPGTPGVHLVRSIDNTWHQITVDAASH